MDKSPDAFRTISEAAEDLDLPQHVLRFWETRFPQIKPLKRGGGRRYYRPEDVALLRVIKQLLYGEGYTIKGVQRLFKEQGARTVASSKLGGASDFVAPGAERESVVEPAPVLPARQDAAAAAPMANGSPGRSADPRPGLTAADLQALQTALADIVEGERILSLARTS
jgi:DNA-binding transcriptional MerR regulator